MIFLLSFLLVSISAISLDTSSKESICKASSLIVDNALSYYDGSGEFSSPYYWWEYGVSFASLLNFQHLCDNGTYESLIYKGILSQTGSNYDFEPESQYGNIGNDDIGTWALTAIQAAEQGFWDPSSEGLPSWAQMAENSFNLLYSRWDDSTCNGGVPWQYNQSRSGNDYKATIANANLFQLTARLARYTNNQTYIDIAEDIYDWISGSGLINPLEYGSEVYDGFYTSDNCTEATKVLWTYNYGVLIGGAAYMFNITEDDEWKDRADSILTGSQILYNDTILYERACEIYSDCNTDQIFFKAIYSRYVYQAAQLIPSFQTRIYELLEPSAIGAAESCSGGSDGITCGINWGYGSWDGDYGLGEQLSALEVIDNLLINQRPSPIGH
ncbi:hypothetical protein WICMUC_002713 [Wickerhamomyces mucosus]|uniref:mannan endo-1,6-alpha-mannosidase n=1 Tax=Wickerhamomyces mucosus TaxID=1378264 RepID=A0A9P8TE37_9ASCO|nr:hypothetical protein WICMUC_002713 [Wickerhamomyces mucosus]